MAAGPPALADESVDPEVLSGESVGRPAHRKPEQLVPGPGGVAARQAAESPRVLEARPRGRRAWRLQGLGVPAAVPVGKALARVSSRVPPRPKAQGAEAERQEPRVAAPPAEAEPQRGRALGDA